MFYIFSGNLIYINQNKCSGYFKNLGIGSLSERFIYQTVSIDTMNTQINLRLPEKMLLSAKSYTERYGFNSLQEFIKETIREKLFETPISKEELALVSRLVAVSEKKNLYSTEEKLFKKLKGI